MKKLPSHANEPMPDDGSGHVWTWVKHCSSLRCDKCEHWLSFKAYMETIVKNPLKYLRPCAGRQPGDIYLCP